MKIACVCYGNNEILYHSLAALISVSKYNPRYHYFIFGYEDGLDDDFLNFLKLYNINFVNIDEDMLNYVDKIDVSYRRYPKEMFLRFYIPHYLSEKGYDYAIMLDYDTYAIKEFKDNEILPVDQLYAGRITGNLSWAIEGAKQKMIKKYFGIESFYQDFVNGGFLIFNLKNLTKSDFSMRFIDIYNQLLKIKTTHPEDELSLGLLTLIMKINFKAIPSKYNYSAFSGFSSEVIMHHFNSYKPWNLEKWIYEVSAIKTKNIIISYILRCFDYNIYIMTLPFHKKILPNGNISFFSLREQISRLEDEYRNIKIR